MVRKAGRGRPKLPKGTAKVRVVQIRLTVDAFRILRARAKAAGKGVSDFIRDTLALDREPR